MGRKSEGFKLRQFEWSQGVWYITWSVEGKTHRRSTGETSRDEAEKYRAAFIIQAQSRNTTDKSLTVEQALDDYMREHSDHSPSRDVTRYNVVHLKSFFGGRQVGEVTPALVKQYIREKENDGYKQGTIRKQLTPLLASFNHARGNDRILAHAPITLPSIAPSKDIYLNQEEAKSLLDNCKTEHMRLFVALALYTGARKGAILALKWSQVNLHKRLIDYNQPGRVQTKKKRPVVPISSELLEMLRVEHKGPYVVMFRGGPLKDIKKSFAEACKASKLKGITPHTLRHTFATWLAQAGRPMGNIAKLLGDSIVTVERNYAHHSPEYMQDDVDVISIKLQTKSSRNGKKPLNSAKEGKKYA